MSKKIISPVNDPDLPQPEMRQPRIVRVKLSALIIIVILSIWTFALVCGAAWVVSAKHAFETQVDLERSNAYLVGRVEQMDLQYRDLRNWASFIDAMALQGQARQSMLVPDPRIDTLTPPSGQGE